MTEFTYITATRRRVLKGALAGTVALAAPSILSAQGTYAGLRKNVASREAAEDIDTYRVGVEAMLKLDPDHPHNWYNNALIHLLDCPHMNWWFFVWHRPYLGYFEEKIRIHSLNPEFSLPYWDWTTEPNVPEQMFRSRLHPENALDPTSVLFEEDWTSFDAKYKPMGQQIWDSLGAAQLAQQELRWDAQNPRDRGVNFEKFWNNSVKSNIVPRAQGRTLTASNPDLPNRNPCTPLPATYVAKDIIIRGLLPTDFVKESRQSSVSAFNSSKSANHHGSAGGAVLEGTPHNLVHNYIGGIMPTLLSSIDPIFFLHHGNIDRLFDVWTRKQESLNMSALPTAADAAQFNPEPFLFFIDRNGKKVTKDTTAGDWMDIGRWGYSYTAGTGEELVGAPGPTLNASTSNASSVRRAAFSIAEPGLGSIALNKTFADAVQSGQSDVSYIAHITFMPPMQVKGLTFEFFISPDGTEPDVSPDCNELAGSFEFFGMDHVHSDAFTITLDVTDAVEHLISLGAITSDAEVSFAMKVVKSDRDAKHAQSDALIAGSLASVDLEIIG